MTLPILPLTVHGLSRAFRELLNQEGVPWQDAAQAEHVTRFLLFDSREMSTPRLQAGQQAVNVHALRLACEGDPLAELECEDAARRQWQIEGCSISEEVSVVPRRVLRRAMMSHLRAMLEDAGGAWVTIGAYPFPYRSAFNFRFDHDGCVADDLQNMLQTIAGFEGATSHYLCGSAFDGQDEALQLLRGLDVGGHGYWHHTYRDAASNRQNIGRGLDVLEAAGLTPSGFVAPHGRYNSGLKQALNELSISHSSEFGLACDELPLFPADSAVLQVPVHPISLGLFLEAARAGRRDAPSLEEALAAAQRHYCQVAREKYQAGDPVFLYGHPDERLGRYPEVLAAVLAEVQTFSAVWKTTLTRFQQWWRARAKCAIRVFAAEEDSAASLLIIADRRPRAFCPAVEIWRGEHAALLPIDGPVLRCRLEKLVFQRRSFKPALPPGMRIDGSEGLRGRVKRYLDWEKATPPGELAVTSLRDLVKKTLRYIRK